MARRPTRGARGEDNADDSIILGDAPLRNLHAVDPEEDDIPDGLAALQRNEPELQTLCIGTEADCGYDRPHGIDWGRAGRYIAMHDHLEELEFGKMESETSKDISFEQFEALCQGMAGANISRLTFYYSNLFGGKECEALVPFLKTSTNLKKWVFGDQDLPPPGNAFDDVGLRMLSQALFMFSSLVEIALPFLSICEGVVEELCEALEGHLGLRILDLSGNDVGSSKGMGCLARMLERPKSQLESLKLYLLDSGSRSSDKWGMGDAGAEVLAGGLDGSSLRRLDISRNCLITEKGWRALFSTLERQNCILEELDLNSCHFNHESMACLAQALAINKSLKKLNLSFLNSEVHNDPILTPKTWEAFFEGLRESHLEELELQGLHFDDQQSLSAGNAIAGNRYVTNLNLKHNGDISIRGWKSITDGLRNPNTALEKLSLRWETINNDEAIVAFADAISANKTSKLRRLYIDTEGGFTSHNITDTGWDAMSNALCNPSSIMATYHSNHTFCDLDYAGHWQHPQMPDDLVSLYELNENNDNRRAARLKVIKTHFGHDNGTMHPLAEFELEVAPHLIAWLGRDDGRRESEKEGKELLFRFFRNAQGIFSLRQNRKRKLRQATLLDMGYRRG